MTLKFLLHTCCAPCSIAIIDELKNKFALTVFFYNPNIFPFAEYEKRKAEVVRVCQEWGVPMIDMDYEADKWHKEVAEGLEMEAEGESRCALCFRFRLAKTAEYAKKNGFHYFSSSLTSGRNKPAEVINSIGKVFGKHYKVKFYDVDWKKDGRQEKAKKMVEERGIYRQNYCGCESSIKKP
ncbi:MAG: epoxyqueuosine reductase QueH [Patescibacteria group bacterium]